MTRGQHEFLKRILPLALGVQRRYAVPASVALAQAILESNWGRSHLAQRGHNLFGMKWAKRHRRFLLLPTAEFVKDRRVTVKARFARYRSEAESFDDWAWLVSRVPRYKPCLERAADPTMSGRLDPVEFARCLQRAGYSTDPFYARKIARVIRRHNLTYHDTEEKPDEVLV